MVEIPLGGIVTTVTARQRLAAFAAVVLLAFAAGYGLGGAVDPVVDHDAPPVEHPSPDHGEHEGGER